MDNEISKNGSHFIQVWREPTVSNHMNGYWDGYTHKGNLMRMDNPKRGQVVEMRGGTYYKITAIGTKNRREFGKGPEPVVFLKEWKQ